MKNESIWTLHEKANRRPALEKNIKTDVCIIGGGTAGVLTALQLKEKGMKSIVIEAGRTGSGQSQNTTAKITAQHGLKYAYLTKHFGEESARQYAAANTAAIDEYERIINKYSIDCDFARTEAYLYSTEEKNQIDAEYKAARKAGIDACLTKETELPIKIKNALLFRNQACFNPLKFLYGAAEKIKIFENTPALSVKGNIVKTDKAIIYADNIVFATHYPFVNAPGFYFARMHQSRSCFLALKDAPKLENLYFSADKHGFSFRGYKNYLIIGGASHRTGENLYGGKYDLIRAKSKAMFPESTVAAQWSAQDCMPADGVPYIGKFAASTDNKYVATGFGKWGMSSSMVAAQIISDRICGKENPYAEVFSPQRFKISSCVRLLEEEAYAVKGIAKELFSIPKFYLNAIDKTGGGVIRYKGKKAGVYKDENGTIYAVDIRCPHLGCQLEWNPDEKSWDCPCHGSRFSYTGQRMDNPAQRNLKTEIIKNRK